MIAPSSSIRSRLFLAFGSVASITVAACVAAWLAFTHLGGSLAEMTGEHMPAMELATRLAEEGGAIRTTAPTLVSADNGAEYQIARDGLERRMTAMRGLLARINASDSEHLQHPTLAMLVEAIAGNLAELDSNVLRRLELARLNRETIERLRWLQADFLDEAEPLVADARFNIRFGMESLERADQAARSSDTPHLLAQLREETNKAEAVLVINANASLLFGLLARSATLDTLTDLESTGYFIGEMADLLEENATVLNNWNDTVTLRQLSFQLLELASIEHGLPALRNAEIAALQQSRTLLADNRQLVDEINTVIAERIAAVSNAAAAAAELSARGIVFGRHLLLALAVFSLAVALAVAWFYVHRNLLRRLTALGDSAHAIAAGDLHAEVPISGRDEITQMAQALLVFRDTAIQVEEANAQAIINNAMVGLLTTNAFGVIAFVNPVAEDLLVGPGKRLDERLPRGDALKVTAFFTEARDNAEARDNTDALLTLETTGRRQNGAMVPLLMGIRPYRQRQRRGFIVTVTDITERRNAQKLLERKVAERTADLTRSNAQLESEITERRRTEQELLETQAELVQAAKLAALGQVAAGVGHELNQPLAAIRSYAHNGRILITTGRHEEANAILEKISELTGRMADISNHLKRFARRPNAVLSEIELAVVVDRALSLFTLRLREEDIEVVKQVEPGLRVRAEEVRLEQVFVNLFSNALDAMRGMDECRLTVSASPLPNGKVDVRVADTGPGIPQDQLPLIFDPFFTSKQVGAGLGLGLSISYNIVKDFQSLLCVHSTGPEGTVFQVMLNRD